MPPILLQCKNCERVFPSGINLGKGASVILKSNVSQCPFCGSMENIPDGTFKGTVEGIVRVLEQSENPLETAKDLLDSLEKSKTPQDLSRIKRLPKFAKFKKWLPNTPEKIAAYILIIQAIIQLLTKNPQQHVEYNVFINTYNEIVVTAQVEK